MEALAIFLVLFFGVSVSVSVSVCGFFFLMAIDCEKIK